MKLFNKIFILFVSITFLRLAVSCCNCESDFYSFDYSSVVIHNIDNSGRWSKPITNNEMSAASIAFEVQIIGTKPVSASSSRIKINGFKTLSAQNCECDDQYVPNQTISDIRIRTLNDINSDYCCNDDVTNLFVANTCVSCEDIGSFYITIDELKKRINPEGLYESPTNKFLIYLKKTVENDKAQFEVEIDFSDGRSIVTQTNLITII